MQPRPTFQYMLYYGVHIFTRCSCGNCKAMPLIEESICCAEMIRVKDRMNYSDIFDGTAVQHTCITNHPGFIPVCLDVWSLQTAYFAFKQENNGKHYKKPQTHK